jgi:hypothetical protein
MNRWGGGKLWPIGEALRMEVCVFTYWDEHSSLGANSCQKLTSGLLMEGFCEIQVFLVLLQ